MTDTPTTATKPLWLAMEERILELDDSDLVGERKEQSIQRIARELDEAGYNVSRHGGNMLELRWAVDARAKVARPMLKDFNQAVGALTLEDLDNLKMAAVELTRQVGESWPRLKDVERRADISRLLEEKKLALQIARAKEMAGDQGIRYLIACDVPKATVVAALDISEARYDEVTAAIAAEEAEVARVKELLHEVEDGSAEDKARHLITNDVSDEDIVKLAGIDQATIDATKQAMEEELREKERLAAEAAEAKRKAAEGPSLEDIPPDEMLEHIEAIREIMEFSDKEDEIRQMCEQSSIPSSLVDVAVSDPDKLDELEKAAEG